MNFDSRATKQKPVLPMIKEPQSYDKLINSMVLREEQLTGQVSLMVDALNNMVEQTKQQHSKMISLLKLMAKRQDRMYAAQKSLLTEISQDKQPLFKLKNSPDDLRQETQSRTTHQPHKSQKSIEQVRLNDSLDARDHSLSKISAKDNKLNLGSSHVEVERKQSQFADRNVPCLSKKSSFAENNVIQPQLQQYQQHSDKTAAILFEESDLIIEFQPFYNQLIPQQQSNTSIQKVLEAISRWTAEVYEIISKHTFKAYSSKHLSESEAKVYFTNNLILNFQQLTRQLRHNHNSIWSVQQVTIIQHFQAEAKNILQYLLAKYPQKRKTFFNEEVADAIKSFDQSDEAELDVLKNMNYYFSFSCIQIDYHTQIKKFLNKLIEETQKALPLFRRTMKEMFTLQGRGELNNLIGMKFRENTPKYTATQFTQNGLEVKTPELLRVIIKWIEQLEKRVKGLADGSTLGQQFNIKSNSKTTTLYLSKEVKEHLSSCTQGYMKQLQQMEADFSQKLMTALGMLPQYIQKYQPRLRHLPRSGLRSGLISYVLSELTENLSVNYLIQLLRMLQKAGSRVSGMASFDESTEQKISLDFQFTTFNISDLLRCKCSGTLQEIQQVYAAIRSNPDLKVYRVKNRLKTSNRDFLINLKMKDTPLLCQVQLAVFDKTNNPKQYYLDHFNHFLYELNRAKYGPIAEAVMINVHLTDFVEYFEKIMRKMKHNPLRLPQNISITCDTNGFILVDGWKYKHNSETFFCSNCVQLSRAHSSSAPNYQQTKISENSLQSGQRLKRTICGECVFQTLKPEDKTRFLLGKLYSRFFEAFPKISSNNCPKILCTIKKNSAESCVEFYQSLKKGQSTIYVSVFYEYCDSEKKTLSLKALENYHLFTLKSDVKTFIMSASSTSRIIFNKKKGPLTLKDLIDYYQLQKLSDRRLADQPRQTVYSNKFITTATLWNMKQNEQVQMLMSPNTPQLLIIDTLPNEQELARLITGYRELRPSEQNKLSLMEIWQLDNNNLGSTSLTEISNNNLDRLLEASLSNNGFTDLSFICSSSLLLLNLSHNMLKQVTLRPDMFPQLQTLNLKSNRIVKIHDLKHTNLNSLELGLNKIQEIKPETIDLPALKQLNLQENVLSKLDLSKGMVPLLTKLNLGNKQDYEGFNRLRSIVLPVQSQYLEELIVNNNHLQALDWSDIELPSLTLLNCEKNSLSSINIPKQLPSLEKLICRDNKLQAYDLSSNHLPCLKTLDLSSSLMTKLTLPSVLCNLQELFIYNNKLEQLNFSQTELSSLKMLSAGNNLIASVTFNPSMKKLSILYIHSNRLTSLDLSSLPSQPQHLSIAHNYITFIKFAGEQQIQKLRLVKADFNPFNLRIPSNIQLVKGKHPQCLKQLITGIDCSLAKFGMWLLCQYSLQERQLIFEQTEQLTGKSIQKGIIETELARNPDEINESETLNQSVSMILKLLFTQEKIPAAHIERAKDFLITFQK